MKAASTASEKLAHTAINVNASIENGVSTPKGQKKPKRDQDPGPETGASSPNRQDACLNLLFQVFRNLPM
jgi:hypothetical protein